MWERQKQNSREQDDEYLDLRRRKWLEAGEGCAVRNFITCIPVTKFCYGDQIKEVEMGGKLARMGR
jgi:hypothetical protein